MTKVAHKEGASMRLGVGATASAAIAVIAFTVLSISHVDRFPSVHEDEPYIAASASQLASGGTHGNPLFTGFHGAERHVFLYPPLLSVIQSVVFRVSDPDVVTMRIPSVIAGLTVLILAGIVGVRMNGFACGALTMVLLIVLAAAAGVNGTSGIPLLDSARIARYDILVPAFGLAGLLAFERASRDGLLWFASGAFAGLATMAHVYGIFWLIGMLTVLVVRRLHSGTCDRQRHHPEKARLAGDAARILAGFAVTLLPLAAPVASDWADFLAQQRVLAERYQLGDPRFYLDNIVNEPSRYGPFLGFDGDWMAILVRPGLWIAAAGIALALVGWFRQGMRDPRRTGFAVGLILLAQVVLFATLVQVKTYSYVITMWTLATVLIAGFAVDVWRRADGNDADRHDELPAHRRIPPLPKGPRASRLKRIALVATLALVVAEGVVRITNWRLTAAQASPYAQFMERVAAEVPPGSHVLGLQQYWLGLQQFRYTSWLVPVWQNDDRFVDSPVPFETALEGVAPDVVLIDSHMGEYFDSLSDAADPHHERLLAWRRFAERHRAERIAILEDETYGTMEVWRMRQDRSPQPDR